MKKSLTNVRTQAVLCRCDELSIYMQDKICRKDL